MAEHIHIDYEAVGNRVHQRRRAMRLTQAELARMTGVSASFIGHIERAEKVASLETMLQLSEALRVPLDWLVKGERASCRGDGCPFYEKPGALLRSYGLVQKE